MSGGSTIDINYLTQPHDGTPGKPWDDFEERLLDVASGKTDERGAGGASRRRATDRLAARLHAASALRFALNRADSPLRVARMAHA